MRKESSSIQKKLVWLLAVIGGGFLGFFIILSFLPNASSLTYSQKERNFLLIERNSTIDTIQKPFLKDQKPKIGLILLKVGVDTQLTRQAMNTLPKEVCFAFFPYTPDIEYWALKAQSQGRSILLTLSLENVTFSQDKEGPYTLLVNVPKEENLKKLEKILSKVSSSVGVVGFMRSRFLASRKDLYPILEFLKAKGYIFIDNSESSYSVTEELEKLIKGPFLRGKSILEERENKENIQEGLYSLEEEALKKGSALGLVYLSEDILPFLQEWITSLEVKGILLVPITTLINENG